MRSWFFPFLGLCSPRNRWLTYFLNRSGFWIYSATQRLLFFTHFWHQDKGSVFASVSLWLLYRNPKKNTLEYKALYKPYWTLFTFFCKLWLAVCLFVALHHAREYFVLCLLLTIWARYGPDVISALNVSLFTYSRVHVPITIFIMIIRKTYNAQCNTKTNKCN